MKKYNEDKAFDVIAKRCNIHDKSIRDTNGNILVSKFKITIPANVSLSLRECGALDFLTRHCKTDYYYARGN